MLRKNWQRRHGFQKNPKIQTFANGKFFKSEEAYICLRDYSLKDNLFKRYQRHAKNVQRMP